MAVRVESHAEPIPGYRLIERLGGGGFGEVWRAEAPGGLHKAIKFVFGDLSSAGDNGARAEQELKALSRVKTVRHPYILSLERYDIIDGQLMIVMELADRNLWDRFKECRSQGLPGIPREELLRYVDESAEALDLMNQQYQLQHLDIKPQNIFLIGQHVKVADFGLVKDLEGTQAAVTGGVTPVYAAPETFEGIVTRYSDQYSLAIAYQELLTGQRPFAGTNVRQLILQHLQAIPNVSPLPPGDRPAVARALSKVPDERFPTCKDFVHALYAGVAEEAGPPAPPSGTLSAGAGTSLSSADTWHGPLATPSASPSSKLRPSPSGSAFDSGPGPATQYIRGAEAPVLRSGAGTVPPKAPPELSGSGALFPALVIGLGQVGMTVLQRLREALQAHVAPLRQLSHLRLLLLDTDPDAMRAATRPSHTSFDAGPTSSRPAAALSANEVLLAPLNRPSYYLKPREGRPGVGPWLNPRMLYRIPRSQVTTGVRALGRLAFCDNYRSIARRLQAELEACVEPAALQIAARQTGLGLRTNRPRVYVVTSLAGGTGSGMFLDLAYVARALLRQMGYDTPDVVGLLLLPPASSARTGVLTLGNTCAALAELNHFGTPGNVFTARYHEREAPIQDSGPPFNRCVILPLPDETDEVASQELIDLSAQYLLRDLCSTLGRVADLGRAGLTSPPWESRGQHYQTFGLSQISWPRHALLQAVARRLCQRLVQRWMSKDAKSMRETVQAWVADQMVLQELGSEPFIHRLQVEAVKALSRPPESEFSAIAEKVAKLAGAPSLSALTDASGRSSRSLTLRPLAPEEIAEALAEVEALVGRPQDDRAPETVAVLVKVLREASERLTNEWGQKLVEIPIHLIEEPVFRLAGAEEAIRHVVATIEQVLQHHEPLAEELAAKAAEAHVRLSVLAAPPDSRARRPACSPADVVELLRSYPKWRYQSLVLQHVAAAFVSLRGHLSDELREVNFCRVRLAELARLLEEGAGNGGAGPRPSPAGASSRQGSIGGRLFGSGCKSLSEAVEQFLGARTAEDLLELDGKMEETLKEHFTALVQVCLSTANNLKNVETAMLETAHAFAASKLPPTSVAELFLEQHPDQEEAEGEVSALYDEASPELTPNLAAHRSLAPGELCVLATPPGPASERFRTIAQKALGEKEVNHAVSRDDILVYRERTNLALTDLEQMGPLGQNAYQQMSATENFTPHSRIDVEFKVR